MSNFKKSLIHSIKNLDSSKIPFKNILGIDAILLYLCYVDLEYEGDLSTVEEFDGEKITSINILDDEDQTLFSLKRVGNNKDYLYYFKDGETFYMFKKYPDNNYYKVDFFGEH